MVLFGIFGVFFFGVFNVLVDVLGFFWHTRCLLDILPFYLVCMFLFGKLGAFLAYLEVWLAYLRFCLAYLVYWLTYLVFGWRAWFIGFHFVIWQCL